MLADRKTGFSTENAKSPKQENSDKFLWIPFELSFGLAKFCNRIASLFYGIEAKVINGMIVLLIFLITIGCRRWKASIRIYKSTKIRNRLTGFLTKNAKSPKQENSDKFVMNRIVSLLLPDSESCC